VIYRCVSENTYLSFSRSEYVNTIRYSYAFSLLDITAPFLAIALAEYLKIRLRKLRILRQTIWSTSVFRSRDRLIVSLVVQFIAGDATINGFQVTDIIQALKDDSDRLSDGSCGVELNELNVNISSFYRKIMAGIQYRFIDKTISGFGLITDYVHLYGFVDEMNNKTDLFDDNHTFDCFLVGCSNSNSLGTIGSLRKYAESTLQNGNLNIQDLIKNILLINDKFDRNYGVINIGFYVNYFNRRLDYMLVLSFLLGGGASGILGLKLRDALRCSYNPLCFSDRYSGTLVVHLECDKRFYSQVESVILREIESINNCSLDTDILDRAINNYRVNASINYDNPKFVTRQATLHILDMKSVSHQFSIPNNLFDKSSFKEILLSGKGTLHYETTKYY